MTYNNNNNKKCVFHHTWKSFLYCIKNNSFSRNRHFTSFLVSYKQRESELSCFCFLSFTGIWLTYLRHFLWCNKSSILCCFIYIKFSDITCVCVYPNCLRLNVIVYKEQTKYLFSFFFAICVFHWLNDKWCVNWVRVWEREKLWQLTTTKKWLSEWLLHYQNDKL